MFKLMVMTEDLTMRTKENTTLTSKRVWDISCLAITSYI